MLRHPQNTVTGRDAYRGLYKSKRWQRLRAAHLAKHPHCQCPHHVGQRVPGNVVDHKTPHKGDAKLFFDPRNLQTMTKVCHDAFKKSAELGGHGFMRGCDATGWPLSREHEWHKERSNGDT